MAILRTQVSMKLLLVAAASLLVVGCASLSSPSLEELEFLEWKLQFGKVYETPEDEAQHRDIWLSTRRRVLAHNIRYYQKLEEQHMDMNKLADQDDDEFMANTDFKAVTNSA